jgi:fatty-acyl-CoA synthase
LSDRSAAQRDERPARLATPGTPRPAGAARTLPELLRRGAAHPDADACGLRFLDRRERDTLIPWRVVAARAERCAGSLRAAGVRRGDRVALVFPTCPEFFDAFFGSLFAGAVPAPLYPPVRLGLMPEYDERTAAMLRGADVRLLLADSRVRRLLGGVLADYLPPLGCRTLDELPSAGATPTPANPMARGNDHARRSEPDEDDDQALALVQFSSGTTSAPKPVALSHLALLEQAHLLHEHFPDTAAIRHSGLSWLPLYHDMGLIGCVLPALMRPADLTLLPPEAFVARPALWLRALSRFRATVSPAPNFAYALATERATDDELLGVDLSSWQVALNGAEAVSAEVLRAFERRFAPYGFRPEAMTPVYGLAEAALAVTFSDIGRRFRAEDFDRAALAYGEAVPKPGSAPNRSTAERLELVSVGRPVPGFALEIRDEEGKLLAERQLGKVLVRGPSLLREYLGLPSETARALQDGWLDTGDLGFVYDGELYLAGRAKDVLVLAGRKHSPEPAERAAGAVPGVRTGCVVALTSLPAGASREELWLLVELRRGAAKSGAALTAIEEQVRRAVVGATGLRPERVLLLRPGALPRTSSGKLRRAEARRRLLLDAFAIELCTAPTVSHLVRELGSRPAIQAAKALLRSRRLEPKRPPAGESD